MIEINDTLAITREQGFPTELDLEVHLKNPFGTEKFGNTVFEFKDKKGIRVYKAPPVRNFLVEVRDGKWIYWGRIHITEIRHDYESKVTSGKFKILHINTSEEMKNMFELTDARPEMNYFDK